MTSGIFEPLMFLKNTSGNLFLALELFDNGAGFVDRIDFLIDDDYVFRPFFQQFIQIAAQIFRHSIYLPPLYRGLLRV